MTTTPREVPVREAPDGAPDGSGPWGALGEENDGPFAAAPRSPLPQWPHRQVDQWCTTCAHRWPCPSQQYLDGLVAVVERTRAVATIWRDDYLRFMKEPPASTQWAIGTHPLNLVLAALDGEADPVHLGVDPERLLILEGARATDDEGQR